MYITFIIYDATAPDFCILEKNRNLFHYVSVFLQKVGGLPCSLICTVTNFLRVRLYSGGLVDLLEKSHPTTSSLPLPAVLLRSVQQRFTLLPIEISIFTLALIPSDCSVSLAQTPHAMETSLKRRYIVPIASHVQLLSRMYW